MSFGDEHTDRDVQPALLTERERELLAKSTWTIDELITLAFTARRLAARVDRVLAEKGRGQ